MNIRSIQFMGKKYLLLEDVASYIRELGGSEETDVRDRLNEAAGNLVRRGCTVCNKALDPSEPPSVIYCSNGCEDKGFST